jgi:hypothetical protein
MPRVVNRLLLALIVAALLFAFTPISEALLRLVHGSFAPTPYSSLALRTPSVAAVGVSAGKPIPVQLTNETGHTKTYHWSATQRSGLISLGEQTVQNGRTTTFLVPSQGATAGRLQIRLIGSNVFVTVHILKPRS